MPELLQEKWYNSREWTPTSTTSAVWHLLVCCVLMNRAPGHRASLVARRFFDRFTDFRDVSEDHVNELAAMFRPLGLQNVRARRIIDMSFDVRVGKAFTDCRGVGDYAADSIRLFVYEDYDHVPKDKELKARRLELLEESKV